MSDVYGIMAELLVSGHGDKTDYICDWYYRYRKAGLSHTRLRNLLVREGYLKSKQERTRDELR